MNITVKTYANIALIKYWGKRDQTLFLPTKNSFSLTLDALSTTTTIGFSDKQNHAITMQGLRPDKRAEDPIISYLDLVRNTYKIANFFSVSTRNSFPTGAGIASSASGFAALAFAINKLCRLGLSIRDLSMLARRGSGSAARSAYGGFVWWHKGNDPLGKDSFAEQLFDHTHWPELRVLIIITNEAQKDVSSRYGMNQTIKTSPLYPRWLESSAKHERLFIDAIRNKDIETLGLLTENEWEGFHQSIVSSVPSLHYWNAESYAIIAYVKKLRSEGCPCFFTTDAGPQVKIICLQDDCIAIRQSVISHFPTIKIIESRIAKDPEVML